MSEFLLDYWYMAAWSHEIGETPLARRILNIPIVIFRGENGELAALEDVCPHRFSRLSTGPIVGSSIECPYHGLRFGKNGNCSHSPFSDVPPPAQKVRSFPVVEDNGFIWLWTGNPELAEVNPIPDYNYLKQTSDYNYIPVYVTMPGNYHLVNDNLVDASHTGWLHRNSLSAGNDILGNKMGKGNYKPFVDEKGIHSYWEFPDENGNLHPNEFVENLWQVPGRVVHSRGYDQNINPNYGLHQSLHLMTPETSKTTHYFVAEFYDGKILNDPQIISQMQEFITNVFATEDAPMVADIQKIVDEGGRQPVLLKVDVSSVQSQREYSRLLEIQNS